MLHLPYEAMLTLCLRKRNRKFSIFDKNLRFRIDIAKW